MAPKETTEETIADLYSDLERRGIKVWIDGGWGVDALLGKQTRPHGDVDFVVQEKDIAALDAFLRGKGYKDVPRDDTRSWNYVLGADDGSEIDIHVININEVVTASTGRQRMAKLTLLMPSKVWAPFTGVRFYACL